MENSSEKLQDFIKDKKLTLENLGHSYHFYDDKDFFVTIYSADVKEVYEELVINYNDYYEDDNDLLN